jgi:2-C-methyl-D-erythritol 4-phosphate cytidylyltransferase
MLAREFPGRRVRAVAGGNSRQQSVENALATLGPETELVAVHDAVRPFIEPETIHKVFDEAAETGAAIVGVPVVDTVKQVSRGTGRVLIRATLPREKLVTAQTPQVFRYELLARAFELAREDGFLGTDEASMVERLDVEVSVVLGSDRNIKITKQGDMDLARLFFHEEIAKEVQP